MSSSNYIESIHMQILHLNKNYFHSKEESTADLTNNLTNNLKSPETQIKIDKNKVIKKILVEEALDKSLFEESNPTKTLNSKERRDANGIPINKNKKHKVTFIDKISKKTPLVTIQNIESYKRYNLLTNFNVNESLLFKEKSTCNCSCIMF
jgi:hypothetical protein